MNQVRIKQLGKLTNFSGIHISRRLKRQRYQKCVPNRHTGTQIRSKLEGGCASVAAVWFSNSKFIRSKNTDRALCRCECAPGIEKCTFGCNNFNFFPKSNLFKHFGIGSGILRPKHQICYPILSIFVLQFRIIVSRKCKKSLFLWNR
jgi:hypothetical protein